MILANSEIRRALREGRLGLDPEPPASAYDSMAVDLTLADELSFGEPGSMTVDPSRGGMAGLLARNSRGQRINEGGYALEPNKLVLAKTREYLRLPLQPESNRSLAARVEGKSSLARCGLLVHFTAPTIHAGFEGTITLEIINLGPWEITLRSGMAICQLLFEVVEGIPSEVQPSQFHGQNTAAGLKS